MTFIDASPPDPDFSVLWGSDPMPVGGICRHCRCELDDELLTICGECWYASGGGA